MRLVSTVIPTVMVVVFISGSLLEGAPTEQSWPRLARLSVGGAQIVSIPTPLVTSRVRPATLESHPGEARLVLNSFEGGLPRSLRLLAELVPRLAAESKRPPAARFGLARRVARRILSR